jgi:ribosomal protein S18 acetylase RimI-like enzyme
VTGGDHERITWALYEAVRWDPQRRLPPFEVLLQHPEIVRYYKGWGRPGDMGAIAERDGEFAGIAFCRLFTDDDHGYGYVDDTTPELAVAVSGPWRNRGIGTELIKGLAERARLAGVKALSLSVDTDNRARRLYERLGFREVSVDQGGVLMLLGPGAVSRP